MSQAQSESQHFAAVDLGSNSFHMVIAKEESHGQIRIIDRVREMVRLNAALNNQGFLTRDGEEKALACLSRFSQRLKDIPRSRVWAVGTNTLRVARNASEFLLSANTALGHTISIISGHEEARLVYLGAAFDLATRDEKRLVIDIGGGSTELIVGKNDQPLKMDSLYIGCVSLTREIFDDGRITSARLMVARQMVLRELEPIYSSYRELGWDEVVGTSGTIKAVDKVAARLGLPRDYISKDSINAIAHWLGECGHYEDLNHVSEQRRPVFVGGFLILAAIFELFDIQRMELSQGALREGVLAELVGRLHNQDSRDQGGSGAGRTV